MLHYILQTVAFQLFFLIIYDVFLKNETFFNWNRVYLIGTAFLSFTLPFLKFESIKAIVPEPMVVRLPEVIIGEVSPVIIDNAMMMPSDQISEQALSFSWTYVWVIGMILAALILAYKIIKIMRMLYKNPQRWQGDALIVFLLNSSAAFSFFHYIFLGNNIQADKKEHIIEHEMVHVKEKHSLDLFVFEILRILFWFNPLIYMYQNRLSTLHEFIADAKAVKYKGKSDYYQNLLAQVFQTQQISFINPFFKQSLIKKRIVMLSKSKSKQIHLIKYALIFPVVMVMLMYTSSYASVIKDPFPFFQKELVNQELTFQELVDKYYKEMVAKNESVVSSMETYKNIIGPQDRYIESKEIVAKRQAFSKYWRSIINSNRDSEGELSEADKERIGKGVKGYETYEEYLAYKKTDKAKRTWENMARDGELRLVVENMGKLTETEEKRKAEKMALIKKDDFYYKLNMTDGKVSTAVDFGKKDKDGNKERFESEDIEVPYAVIEEVPLIKGCEPSGSKDDDKACTSQKIAQFVNENFNTNLASALGLKGRQRISVIFKIGKDGKVRDVMSRAPHPDLEAEAIRVIKLLPDFTPGKQRGIAVTVPYSLPILFQVQDDDPEINLNKNDDSDSGDTEVSLVALDEIPLFSGHQPSGSIESDRQATSTNVSRFVNNNFNTNIAKEHHLTGRQRISVIFKIGADGKVRNIKARAAHPALEAEAIRVIELMPDFTPGKQNGKAVTVPYSLPILFQVQEDPTKTNEKDDTDGSKNSNEKWETEMINHKKAGKGQEENIEVPYAVIEEPPVYPSCESMDSQASKKQCTSNNISNFVNKNFDLDLAEKLGLKGVQRLMVIFKIGKDGHITDIKARGPHPELEKEAIRVIQTLPKMIPGKQRGKKVTVPYSLPIVFQVQ